MLVFLLRVLCKRGWDTRLQCSTIGLQMYQLLKLTAVDQNSNQTQTLKLVIILNHFRFETSKSKLFMLFQITKIYVWLSLSLCFSLRAERGGAVGVVWWCTEISEARWEIVSGALQVLTQHGNTHWCDTVTIASQQNIFHQRRYRQLQITLRRQNKEGIEHKRVRRVESLEEKKSASPYTPDLSLPWSDSKIRVWKYAKKT